jgi:hypothetical protein
MSSWLAIDRAGHLGYFDTEHDDEKPSALVGDPEAGFSLAFDLIRRLHPDARPVAGTHVAVRQGTVIMLADVDRVRGDAERVDNVGHGVIVASFAASPSGKPSDFLAGVRTFGDPEPAEPTALERVHAAGACKGCVADFDDDPVEVLHALGFYIYDQDEDDDGAVVMCRALVPSSPRHVSTIGDLARHFLACTGAFADDEQLSLQAFEPAS